MPLATPDKWYKITWRMIWFIPLYCSRLLFAFVVLCMWLDWQMARSVWRDTE